MFVEGTGGWGMWAPGLLGSETAGGVLVRCRYIGEFKAGMRHGTGTLLGRQGGKYEGEWAGSLRHGLGKETWPNGERVGALPVCDFQNNNMPLT